MNPTNQIPVEPTAAPEVETIAGYRVHPAAILLPAPSEEEYERLKADIKQNGLRVPIVLTTEDRREGILLSEGGLILDGRSRARACDELGIKVTAIPIYRFGETDTTRHATSSEMDDPAGFVLSMNAARRHLKADQLAALYLRAAAAKVQADQQAAAAAVVKQEEYQRWQEKVNVSGSEPEPHVRLGGKKAARIAKKIGVSRATVERVQRVQKVAPEKMAEVAAGKVSAVEVLKGAQSGKKKTAKGKASAAKAGKQVTGQGYQGYDMKYGVGRRSIESLMVRAQPARYAVELWLQRLADAKRMGHAKFDEWLEPAVQWYSKVGIVLDMLQKRPAPTGEEIEAILNPDQQQDEAAEAPDSVAQP